MSTLSERIAQDLTAAMKARDAPRTSVLRMAKAALKNREIDKNGPLDDADAVKVMQGLAKQREDSIEHFRGAGRAELVAKEEAELAVLRSYLPQQASEAAIAAAVERAVSETGAGSIGDMGRVMKAALAALQDGGTPADGKRVSEAVRRKLGG